MANWPLKFDQVFKISTSALRYNDSHPNITVRNKFWVLRIIIFRIIALLCFVFLVNSIIFHDLKAKKYTEAIKNAIMAIVAVTVTLKHSILVHRHESFKNLIDILDKDYTLAEELSDEEQKIVLKYAQTGIRVCRFWLFAASLTSFMFPVKALALMGYYYMKNESQLIPMFDLTYPQGINEYKDTLFVYTATFAMCFIFDIFSMTVYIGFDPLVPIFMLHSCGQLDIISRSLSRVFTEASNTEEIKQNFKRINLKLIQIYRFVQNVQDIVVVLYEFNMKTTTFLLPFSVFQIVETIRNREIPLEFFFFFLGAILHFYMPCYYSNLLMEKSETLRQAIYSSGWEKESNIQIRKIILLMMTRTSAPLVIKTVFYPICLDTFAEMCRQAYGIYNIMNAAWT